MNQSIDFAVTDCETTGLFPKRHDRLVEIAILRLDPRGKIVGEFESVINPERDVGPTHIHGLRSGDVLKAPTFQAIAGDILHWLNGAVLVGHNVHFDLRFLRSEFDRIGLELPDLPLEARGETPFRACSPFSRGESDREV